MLVGENEKPVAQICHAPLALATPRRILDRAVADNMLVQGYHFPFPATGHIAKRGNGYEFVPATMWQPTP